MPVVIPFKASSPFHTFSTPIGDDVYHFNVRWNGTTGQWSVDISEENGNIIVAGAVIVIGAAIGRTSTHKLFLEGVIVARDTSGGQLDATLDDLGTRVEVRYLTKDEQVSEILADLTGTPIEVDETAST